jgi:hypothetical protein
LPVPNGASALLAVPAATTSTDVSN